MCAVTIGEIQAGIKITREQDAAKAAELDEWLGQVSRVNYICRLRRLVLPVHPLWLAALLGRAGAVAGDVEFKDDGVMDHPVNGRGGGHGVGEDAFPLREEQVGRDAQRSALVAFGDEGEEDLRFLGALGQVAQVVQDQEVEVVQLAQLPGQGEIAFGGEQVLHQTVGWGEEDGVSSFHQAMAQGAQGVGLAGAGQTEGQDVDPVFHEAALGQVVQLLPQGQRHPVVLEGLPGFAGRQPRFPTAPDDAALLPVLGFLIQHLEEGGQGVAVAGGG